jgi:hypothetical protein
MMRISGGGVWDTAGRQLDADGNGTAGGDGTFPFFSLAGDANHDRRVDFLDLAKLAQNYNSSEGGKTYADGDFNALPGRHPKPSADQRQLSAPGSRQFSVQLRSAGGGWHPTYWPEEPQRAKFRCTGRTPFGGYPGCIRLGFHVLSVRSGVRLPAGFRQGPPSRHEGNHRKFERTLSLRPSMNTGSAAALSQRA